MSYDPVPLHVRVMRPAGIEHVLWNGERLTVGRADTNDVVITDDPEISRVHAAVEWVAHGWCVRDLDSSNGTFLNGSRLRGDKPLNGFDEVRVGRTRLLLSARERGDAADHTDAPPPAPLLTAREREVLLAMLAPFVAASGVGALATPGEVAAALSITEAGVRQHLAVLYRKFAIDDTSGRRPVRLANEAMRRGAVTLDDLEPPAR